MDGRATLTMVTSRPTISRLTEQIARTSRRRRRPGAAWDAPVRVLTVLMSRTVGPRVRSRSSWYRERRDESRTGAEHRRRRGANGTERARAAVLRARGPHALPARCPRNGRPSPLHADGREVAGALHQAAGIRDAAGAGPTLRMPRARGAGQRAGAPGPAARAASSRREPAHRTPGVPPGHHQEGRHLRAAPHRWLCPGPLERHHVTHPRRLPPGSKKCETSGIPGAGTLTR